MSRAVCKEILDHTYKGYHAGVEAAISQLQRLADRDEVKHDVPQLYRQQLADVESSALFGKPVPHGGLIGIIRSMDDAGYIDDDVRRILPAQ